MISENAMIQGQQLWPRTDRLVLYLTVSLTGAAIMMLELLGTRIIGPFYGVGLFVWSSLISVTLIALALGYFLGGLLADRIPHFRLSHIVILAALCSSLIPVCSRPVLEATNSLGIRGGSFASALILFTTPLTFLGMVGPQVIKLTVHQLDEVGTTSGVVYAISTIGSVLGTLFLGFFLLPAVGSSLVIYGVSIGLAGLSILLASFEHRRWGLSSKYGLLFVIGTACSAIVFLKSSAPQAHAHNFQVRYEAESVYGWVRVVDEHDRHARWLLSDSSVLSVTQEGQQHAIFSYLRLIDTLPLIYPQISEALLIGLGGGHLVGSLDQYDITTDAIEIDPKVVEAARNYFDFEPTGRLIVDDARHAIRKLDKQYDLIIHDSFTGGSMPVHLLSMEVLTDLRRLLKEDGILALVFVGFTQGEESLATASVCRTVEAVFPHQRVFVSRPGKNFNDLIFLASNHPIHIDSMNEPTPKHQETLNWMLDREQEFDCNDGLVITDDFNPLENLQITKTEAYRQLLVERVGIDLLLR